MNKCPITYQECGDARYSKSGLKKLSPVLTALSDLPFTAQEQRREAALRAAKMSIQGVQAKLSARLAVKNQHFAIVDKGGTYIIKPQSDIYQQLPENEGITMKMAAVIGIDVPLSGMVYCKDGSFSYFVKRFDRYGKTKKYALEDFAQLTNNTRDTKYNWSMEKLIPVIEEYCTFPMLEKLKLLRKVLFCFITGNEDMHLKNFSLITRNEKVELSPAYDLLNSTIALGNATEEMALTLAGKKRKITAKMLLDYFARERMKLTKKAVENEYQILVQGRAKFAELVRLSFLSEQLKQDYLDLLSDRYKRLKS